MKVLVALVLFLGMVNLNEACGGWGKKRNRNPRIIPTRSLPAVTEALQEPTEEVVLMTTEAAGEEAEKVKTTQMEAERPTEKPAQVVTTEARVNEVEAEITTESPAVQAVDKTSAKPAVIEPVTRPTSVHRFFKQSAIVKSGTDDRTCKEDVGGTCLEKCKSNQYVRGRFQCPFPTNCCVAR